MARLNELLKIVKSLLQQEKAELIAFLSSDTSSSAKCESGFNFIKQRLLAHIVNPIKS